MVNGLNGTLPFHCPVITGCCGNTIRNNLKQKSSPFGPNLGQTKLMANSSPNILVVEDDRETRTLIAKYLRNNACNVTAVSDGRGRLSAEAVQPARAARPHQRGAAASGVGASRKLDRGRQHARLRGLAHRPAPARAAQS